MTAPADALLGDGPDPRSVRPGETFAASFTISIADIRVGPPLA